MSSVATVSSNRSTTKSCPNTGPVRQTPHLLFASRFSSLRSPGAAALHSRSWDLRERHPSYHPPLLHRPRLLSGWRRPVDCPLDCLPGLWGHSCDRASSSPAIARPWPLRTHSCRCQPARHQTTWMPEPDQASSFPSWLQPLFRSQPPCALAKLAELRGTDQLRSKACSHALCLYESPSVSPAPLAASIGASG